MNEAYCGPRDFPGYQKSTARTICYILYLLESFAETVYLGDIYIYILAILINIFHFLVLTRKSMRSSSINIIMAYVAFFDIASQFYWIQQEVNSYYQDVQICVHGKFWYYLQVIGNFLYWIHSVSRRHSTWLSFSIAVIRTLVVRYPMNTSFEKLSKPKTAHLCVIGLSILTLPLIVLGFFEKEAWYVGWTPCEPSGSFKYWNTGTSDFFMANKSFLFNLYNSADGILSKLKSRQQMMSSRTNKSTTKLVFYLAITFFLAEFPLGIITMLYIVIPSPKKFPMFPYFLYHFFNLFSLFLSVTTCTHMVVCLFLSSQYRETISVFVCRGCVVKTKDSISLRTAPMTVTTIL
ncbi:hypothetical protein CRE_09494 [Caenorhabditis remanei]|uniref:G-protein coupled receptors family 1 profile domain-containing protein n=1 Tax=Caenorhabditis remanei TaxID=31234 RepID=E3MJ55_CAERE|nr:hypothetical protein CRE_09494 [Caenorhabditis remanei]